MAERRMFAKTIIDSDAFLDMPLSTQALYFHLSMRADDEGFINNPKKIQRMIGASDDDLKILSAKNFIIPFETGIVVIKHWKIHNYIRGDRKHETKYTEELSRLTTKENGAYTLSQNTKTIVDSQMSVICQSDDSQMSGNLDTEVRLGKDSIGKYSLVKDKYINNNYIGDSDGKKSDIDAFFDRVWKAYPRKKGKGQISDAKKKYLFKHVGEEQLLRCIDRFKAAMDGKDEQYIMYGSTFFNSGYIDYLDENCEQQTHNEEDDAMPFR